MKEIRVIEPVDIYVDPEATHLFPRWWHKFLFWKKYKYPEWKITSKRVSVEKIKGK